MQQRPLVVGKAVVVVTGVGNVVVVVLVGVVNVIEVAAVAVAVMATNVVMETMQ